MCLRCQSNTFPFFHHSNSDRSIINSGFHKICSSLFKHFENLRNLWSLLKHSFDILGISEQKVNKGSEISTFNLRGYTLCF